MCPAETVSYVSCVILCTESTAVQLYSVRVLHSDLLKAGNSGINKSLCVIQKRQLIVLLTLVTQKFKDMKYEPISSMLES